MKRKTFFILAAMLLCGSLSAQTNHYTYNYHHFEHKITVVAQINIDGVEQTSSDYEIGAFDGTNVTGSAIIHEYGSNHYPRAYFAIFYNTAYDATFKLYNHATGVELTNCTITDHLGEPLTFVWTDENGYGTNKKPVIFNFITTPTQTLTKNITGYGNGNGNWYLIASPFADDATPTTVGMITNDEGEGENASHTFDLYWFDQSEQLEWRNYRQVPFDLVNGKGYLYANKNDVTLTFTGTPIEGTTKEVPLVKDDNAEFPGWNLVGNPFATNATLDLPYYRLNQGSSALNTYTENTEINVMEGVFVQATDQTPSATFTKVSSESMRVSQLNVKVTRNRSEVLDNAIIRFDDGATLGKFQLNPSHTKVYITQGNQDLAVARSTNESEMPVNFKAEVNGTYTLNFDAEGVSFDYLYLIDKVTGNDVDLLANPSYSFEAKTTDYEGRFKLVFVANSEDGPSTGSGTFAFNSNGNWIISNPSTNSASEASLEVIDIMGRVLNTRFLNGNANINLNFASGVYILRLVSGNNVKVQKVVVR